jgi:alpha-amylase
VPACRQAGLQVYADVVFNHKIGADSPEDFGATPFDPANRNQGLGDERTIRAWTNFRFEGRRGHYSNLIWHWYHFDAVDHNLLDQGMAAIWKVHGADFEHNVDLEKGNYDYLMGCDLNINHPEVRSELKAWGEWTLDTVGVDGFRLDAIKHIASDFFIDWIGHVEQHAQRDLFVVGEYWSNKLESLSWYAANSGGRMSLFDAPLHYNFHAASTSGGQFDMQRLLDGSLMQAIPLLAVTLVDNHDTQPLQSLESTVEPWFKPLAYALILILEQGTPCIFYPDLFGARYADQGGDGHAHEIVIEPVACLPQLLRARLLYAHGPQSDLFDDPHCVGVIRHGTQDQPGCVLLVSNGEEASKSVQLGPEHAGASFHDFLGHHAEEIIADENGSIILKVPGGSISLWVRT